MPKRHRRRLQATGRRRGACCDRVRRPRAPEAGVKGRRELTGESCGPYNILQAGRQAGGHGACVHRAIAPMRTNRTRVYSWFHHLGLHGSLHGPSRVRAVHGPQRVRGDVSSVDRDVATSGFSIHARGVVFVLRVRCTGTPEAHAMRSDEFQYSLTDHLASSLTSRYSYAPPLCGAFAVPGVRDPARTNIT